METKMIVLLKSCDFYKISRTFKASEKVRTYRNYNPHVEEVCSKKAPIEVIESVYEIILESYFKKGNNREDWGGWKELTKKEIGEIKKLIENIKEE